jgi:hypothetical protein
MLVSAIAAAATFARSYARRNAENTNRITEARTARDLAERARAIARERQESRQRLEQGFARIASDEGRDAIEQLRGLEEEFDALQASLERTSERRSLALIAPLPGLTEEVYRHGMSALSDALELLEAADGTRRERIERELADVEERLARDHYAEATDRSRDEVRRETQRQLLSRLAQSRSRAQDLVFEAERCCGALAEARFELAASRSGDTRVDVGAVVETLQQTIRRVRDVQEEFRRLGH